MRRVDIRELAPWLEWRFDPAGGPGGQHVNKVSTRATLLFDFQNCPLFTAEQRDRVARRCASCRTRDGRLRVVARQQRSQAANRAVAEERLLDLLEEALRVRTPRRPTRPTAASRRRRVREKQQRGDVKRGRQARPSRDD